MDENTVFWQALFGNLVAGVIVFILTNYFIKNLFE